MALRTLGIISLVDATTQVYSSMWQLLVLIPMDQPSNKSHFIWCISNLHFNNPKTKKEKTFYTLEIFEIFATPQVHKKLREWYANKKLEAKFFLKDSG